MLDFLWAVIRATQCSLSVPP